MKTIPGIRQIQYRCALNVESDGQPMQELRLEIRSWLSSKEAELFRGSELSKSWFFVGSDQQIRIGDYLFRIGSNIGDYTKENPHHWVLEMIHPDSDHRCRFWGVEVSLNQLGEKSVRMLLTLSYWINEGFLGETPPDPEFMVPRIVKSIISNKSFLVYRDVEKINSKPVNIDVGSGKDLAERIKNKRRVLPFILVSPLDGKYLFDHEELLKMTVGNANIFVLKNDEVVEEFNYYVGKDLSIRLGSIRVYSQVTSAFHDSLRHRFFNETAVKEFGKEKLLSRIAFGISRNNSVFNDWDIATYSNLQVQRSRNRFDQLLSEFKKNGADTEELKELQRLFEEENQRLVTEKRGLLSDSENLSEEVDELKAKLHEYETRILHSPPKTSTGEDILINLWKLPESISEVLTFWTQYDSERIVFADQVDKSYKEINTNLFHIKHTWSMIWSMYFQLYDIIFGKDKGGDIESKYNDNSEYKMALNEGKMTNKDKELDKLRRLEYDGETYEMYPHLKIGNRPGKQLRVYFAIDSNKKRFIIGNISEHLDNYTTKKM